MARPLMPKATAVWLVENTGLSFRQIAEFCGLHELEIQAIADDEVAIGMVGMDPVASGQLTKEEIARCARDPAAKLRMAEHTVPLPAARSKGPRYTPVTKRADKPDAIAWLLKNYPDLSDAAICRLIGTTKPTIAAVRDKTHWNAVNIKPRNPVLLGLCNQIDIEEALRRVRSVAGRPDEPVPDEPVPDEPVSDEPVSDEPADAQDVAVDSAEDVDSAEEAVEEDLRVNS